MPDLQSELKAKVAPTLDNLAFDDDDDPSAPSTTEFPSTVHVSRATFEFVVANSGLYTRAEIGRLLADKGFKTTSVIALLTQMVREGMVSKTADGRIVAVSTEYTPIRAKQSAVATPKPMAKTIDIGELKISEARAIYDELRRIFGD